MRELDLHRSLSEIAYSAGVAAHPGRGAEVRAAGVRRRRRRTALVAAGSAVVVAATAVGALALSPIGDDSTQPVTPPSTDSPTVTPPSETPTPTETPSPQVTGLAADPFLPDTAVQGLLGPDYGAAVRFDEPEWECTLPGIDVTNARDLRLARWSTEPGDSLSEYVMQFDSAAAADAAVASTGGVWDMCRPPELEFGGSLAGPTAIRAGDEAFAYTTIQPATAEAAGFHTEVQIARVDRVVVVLQLFGQGEPPAAPYLSEAFARQALGYATGGVAEPEATPSGPDVGWLRAADLPPRPFVTWVEGSVATRRSDFGFTACDQDLLPSENGVTRQQEKSFGDEGAIATQAQLLFGDEGAARSYVASFGRLFNECGARVPGATVRSVPNDGAPIAAWELQLRSEDSSSTLGIYYGIARAGSVVTVIELVALPESADIPMADDAFVMLVNYAWDRLAARLAPPSPQD